MKPARRAPRRPAFKQATPASVPNPSPTPAGPVDLGNAEAIAQIMTALEASLARAYLSAGGPPLSNPSSYVGRGYLSICTMRLGGRCRDRIYHVDRADEFDVTHSCFLLNSSLAPVCMFRGQGCCVMVSLACGCSYGPYWSCHLA